MTRFLTLLACELVVHSVSLYNTRSTVFVFVLAIGRAHLPLNDTTRYPTSRYPTSRTSDPAHFAEVIISILRSMNVDI
jgi:hypothetical protein